MHNHKHIHGRIKHYFKLWPMLDDDFLCFVEIRRLIKFNFVMFQNENVLINFVFYHSVNSFAIENTEHEKKREKQLIMGNVTRLESEFMMYLLHSNENRDFLKSRIASILVLVFFLSRLILNKIKKSYAKSRCKIKCAEPLII